MSEPVSQAAQIAALLKSYTTPAQTTAPGQLENMLKVYSANQIALYKAMGGVVNPYTLYNNQDRFLNASIRYRNIETGQGAAAQDWWQRNVNGAGVAMGLDPLKEAYLTRSFQMAQYMWASTGLLGVGYSIYMQPGIIGKASTKSQYESKREFSDAEWWVAGTRSIINAGLENYLVWANYYRYQPVVQPHPVVAVDAGQEAQGEAGNVIEMEQLHHPDPDPEVEEVDFLGAGVNHEANALDEQAPVQVHPMPEQGAAANQEVAPPTIGEVRALRGYYAGIGFVVNGLIGMGMASAKLDKVRKDPKTTTNDVAIAATGLVAITFNTLGNAAKAKANYQIITRQPSASATYWNMWGTGLALVNGLANITSAAIQIDDVQGEQRGVLITAVLLQTLLGGAQIYANQVLATRIASGLTTNAALAGPLWGTAFAGAVGTLNAAEIWGLVQESRYQGKLEALGNTMAAQGYVGDTYLAEMYAKKLGVDAGIFAATSLLTFIAVAVQVGYLAAPAEALVAGGATYAGSGLANVGGLLLNNVSLIFKGIQQELIEGIAREYRRKIEKTGSFSFFSADTLASYKLMLSNPDFQASLSAMQTDFGVDSVIGVSSVKMSPQGLELAAFTKLAAQLDSANFYIDRFVGGMMKEDKSIAMDPQQGVIDLGGTGSAGFGKSQVLKFLTPLMAPGTEKRTRVKTGKDSYYTSLDILSSTKKWTITDGTMNTIMDVRNVVTTLYASDKVTVKFSVALELNGGAGDDTVFAGASSTTFDGGAGIDLMSYAGLSSSSSIVVEAVNPGARDDEFIVHKSLVDAVFYKEVITSSSYSVGKRSETVEYRDVVVDDHFTVTANDTLHNVEIISGSPGNDLFSGNAGNNNFRGEAGNDTLKGLAGDDLLCGGMGNDVLNGGDGTDTALYVDNVDRRAGIEATLEDILQPINPEMINGQPAIYGSVRENWQTSDGATPPTLTNIDNVDKLISIENLAGTKFDDAIAGSHVANVLSGGDGNDRLYGLAGDDTLVGSDGNDSLYGGDGNDYFLQNDRGTVPSFDNIDGGAGVDLIDYSPEPGRTGSGQVVSINADLVAGRIDKNWLAAINTFESFDLVQGIEQIIGTAFNDVMQGDAADNTFVGIDGNDSLAGAGGNDTLVGGKGDDTLFGGNGNDMLVGGIGNDVLSGDEGNDTLSGGEGIDTLWGGAGSDWADFSEASGPNKNGVLATLGTPAISTPSTTVQEIPGTGKFGHWDASGVFHQDPTTQTTLHDIENLIGTDYDDQLTGNDLDNALFGNSGNDLLMGGAGNDLLHGGAGIDTLWGGSGSDWADFSDASGAGDNAVWAFVGSPATEAEANELAGWALFGHWDAAGSFVQDPGSRTILHEMENLAGTRFNDRLSGNDFANYLFGNGGADHLEGRAGNDTMEGGDGADDLDGGAGDDLFMQNFDAVNDTLNGGEGSNTVDYSMVKFINGMRDHLAPGTGIIADLEHGRIDKFPGSTVTGATGVDSISNIENVTGSMLNDQLLGDAEQNALLGAAGDDYIDGGDNADYLDAGGGNDSLIGGSGDDTLIGGEGQDSVTGNAGNDTFLQAFELKNDTLDGGDGIDVVSYQFVDYADPAVDSTSRHGVNADLSIGRIAKFYLSDASAATLFDTVSNIEDVFGTRLDDTLTGDGGDNYLGGLAGDDTLAGGDGNDMLAGGDGADLADGGAGDDRFIQDLATANDTLDGGAGVDTLDYSMSAFTIAEAAARNAIGIAADTALGTVIKNPLDAAHASDTIRGIEIIKGTILNDSLLGDDGSNHFNGLDGNDTLDGRAGNDFLEGGYGNDSLGGGAGNDTLSGDAGNDTISGGAGDDWIMQHLLRENDIINGGDGIDEIDYNVSEFAGNTRPVLGQTGISANLTTGRIDKFEVGAVNGFDTVTGIERISGTIFNDTLIGDALANQFEGGAGNDVISGLDGDDVLLGSSGNDSISGGKGDDFIAGGTGNDTLAGGDGSDYYEISANSGADLIDDFSTLADMGDVLEFLDGVVSGDLWFSRTGNNLLITVLGSQNNVTVKDWFVGASHQIESIRTTDGLALSNLQLGTLLNAMAPYAIPANSTAVPADVSNLIAQTWAPLVFSAASSAANEATLQSAPASMMTLQRAFAEKAAMSFVGVGDETDNYFAGQDGNDTLDGGAGNDILSGAAGNDSLAGAEGDDILYGGSGRDSLYGGAGNDVLYGEAGADLIDGGAGDDVIMQDLERRIDTINGGEGEDTIRYSSQANPDVLRKGLGLNGINANLATGRVDKFEAGSSDAFDLVSGIDNISGTDLNDTIIGDAHDNLLLGGAGDDSLDGGDGQDIIDGGSGNNTLVGGKGNDLILGREGNDFIRQDLSRENDMISGGGGFDVLDYSNTVADSGRLAKMGSAGIRADLAAGRIDKFEPGASLGFDTVKNVENLIGSVFDDLVLGDWFNNFLAGIEGDDTLDGGAGYDTLDGGSGNDVLVGGTEADLINGGDGNDLFLQNIARELDTLVGGAGIDTVDYSRAFDPAASRGWLGRAGVKGNLATGRIDKFESGSQNAFDTISGIENLTGSALNDTLAGSATDNVLDGAGGDDVLSGGGGNDTLRGNSGDDRMLQDSLSGSTLFDGGEGSDTADYSALVAAGVSVTVDMASGSVTKSRNGVALGRDSLRNVEAVVGSAYNDSMAGDAGNDRFNGSGGDDTLIGGSGDDTLIGGSGNDSIAGGAGNDCLVQDGFDGSDVLDGGLGIDVVDYSQARADGGIVDISVNMGKGSVAKSRNGVVTGIDALANIEGIIGSTADDTFIGGLNRSVAFDGGDGNDSADYRQLAQGSNVAADLRTGVVTKYQAGVAFGSDRLSHIERFTGSVLDDIIVGDDNGDDLSGDAGNDSLVGGAGDDLMAGATGDDVLAGGAGDDTLTGGAGRDILNGGEGADLFVQEKGGGSYWNGYYVSDGDSIDGGAGIDTVDYRGLAALLRLNVDLGAGTAMTMTFGRLTNDWKISSTDVLTSVERVIGSRGADSIAGSGRGDSLFGDAGNDTLRGGIGRDMLSGGADDDLLLGAVGGDTLSGGTGNDTLIGGAGHDLIFGDEGNDVIVQDALEGNDDITGGDGIDTLDYGQVQLAGDLIGGISADLGARIVTKIVAGIVVGTDAVSTIDILNGTRYDDTLVGSGKGDTLNGGAGNDRLAEHFEAGNNILDGGDGDDIADYSLAMSAGASISVNLASSTVTRFVDGVAIGTDTLRNIEAVIGSSNGDRMDGGAGNDILIGGAGNDTMTGGAGNDLMMGGEGDDLFLPQFLNDRDTIDGGAGNDSLDFSKLGAIGAYGYVVADLAAGIIKQVRSVGTSYVQFLESGSIAVANVEAIIGSDGSDRMSGSGLSELLNGAAGDDTLSGGDGADTLVGGRGNDVLDGGTGNDLIMGGAGDDLIIQNLLAGADTIDGGDGNDTLDYSQSAFDTGVIGGMNADLGRGSITRYRAGIVQAIDSVTQIESLIGSIYNDTIAGSTGTELLKGGAGDDLFVQGVVGGSDVLDGGAGVDTVDYSQFANAGGNIRYDVAGGTVTKFTAGIETGIDLLNSIEIVIGSRFNDTMIGSARADCLSGAAGNDSLVGGAGNDTLNGGDDKDTLVGNAGNDNIAGDSGDDLILQEGMSDSDSIDGGAGFDTIDYSATISSGGGLDVNLVRGTVIKSAGGIDTVRNIEAVIGGAGNDTLAGTVNADSLGGGAGDDSLVGSAGNDTLDGGSGCDTLDYRVLPMIGGAAGGTGGIIANLQTGQVAKLRNGLTVAIDSIRNSENLLGTGFNDTIIGDAADNLFAGGAGNNVIVGGAGDDMLLQDAWRSNDTLDGGTGQDTVDYGKAVLASGVVGGIKANLLTGVVLKFENAVLVATDTLANIEVVVGTRFNDTITGDGNNNALTGGEGNNQIAGGAGDDTVLQTALRANDTIDGGNGNDRVNYSQLQVSAGIAGGIRANLAGGTVQKLENGQVVATDVITNVEALIGTQFNDTIEGNDSANLLIAGDGDDYLLQSHLFAKNDTIDGGNGNDTIDYRQVKSAPGTIASISYNLTEGWVRKFENGVLVGTDTIRNIESIIGTLVTGNQVGNDAANTLKSSAGNDVILAKGGDDRVIQEVWTDNDVFDGGEGRDTLDYRTARSVAGARSGDDTRGLNVDFTYGRVEKYENGRIVAVDYISNFENVVGSPYDDTMTGQSEGRPKHVLDGAAGNDVLVSIKWGDTLLGGDGDDRLQAYVETSVDGGAGDDLISVYSKDARVTIDGGDGSDSLDLFDPRYPLWIQLIKENPAYATRYSATIALSDRSTWGSLVIRNIENLGGTYFGDSLRGDAGANRLSGRQGDDMLDGGAGNDTLNGGDGNDILVGGDGNDLFVQDILAGSDTINGGNGIDTVDYTQASWTQGGAGKIGIIASFSSGTVRKIQDGLVVGTDTLTGIERLIGTQGDDSLGGGATADLFGASLGSDVIDGGAGIDTVDYLGSLPDDVDIALDVAAGTVHKYRNGQLIGTDTLRGIEVVLPGRRNDRMLGSANADTLDGGDGDDSLIGGAGDDVLNGGFGNDVFIQDSLRDNDSLDGGAGIDLADYSALVDAGASVNVDLAAGVAKKIVANQTLGTDTLRNIESVRGSRNGDVLLGSANGDSLDGGEGNDTLNGNAGNDLISGGGGDDTLLQAGWRDNDTLAGNAGIDSLDYSVAQFAAGVIGGIGANLGEGRVWKMENGISAGLDLVSGIENIIGTRFNDTIVGDAGNNVFVGGDGNDQLSGGDGDDVVVQTVWSNSDTIDGGAGNDLVDYSGIPLPKVLASSVKLNTMNASLSDGLVMKYENGMLVATDRLHDIENIIGTLFNDTLVGDAGANLLAGQAGNDVLDGANGDDTLDGGAGSDLIRGGAGDDRIVQVQAVGNDSLDGGTGFDVIDYRRLQFAQAGSVGISVNLFDPMQVKKYDNYVLVGTDSLANIEKIIGSTLADNMIGAYDDDCFEGFDGNDNLFGLNGNDTLSGGDGNDKLDGGTGSDMISGGNGDDLIRQELLDRVSDTIDGGTGVDTVDYSLTNFSSLSRAMRGVTGIHADLGTGRIDKFEPGAANGFDLVSNIENLIGTVFNDTMIGSGEDNLFNGGSGDDWLTGGGGNDTLVGGEGNDVYHLEGDFGHVTVRDLAGTRDVLEIADATPDAFMVARTGMDLTIWRNGTDANLLTIADWYSQAGFQIEEFRIGDALIKGSDLNLLVLTSATPMSQLPRTLQ